MTSTLSGHRAPPTTVHASTGSHTRNGLTFHQTACGGGSDLPLTTGPGMPVTCKRCLASLAKRDRAFQRKARKHFAPAVAQARSLYAAWPGGHMRLARETAARAIAREEGRS